jgi:hypothetical protein
MDLEKPAKYAKFIEYFVQSLELVTHIYSTLLKFVGYHKTKKVLIIT